MKLIIRVKPNSKEDNIEKIGDNEYVVKVKEPAEEGKANTKMIKLLADFFNVNRDAINIKIGHKLKNKIVEIS